MFLENVLGTKNQIRVLRVLSQHGGITGREVARLAGVRPSAALFALKALEEAGLVRRVRQGNRWLYSTNRAHVLAPHIQTLFLAEYEVGTHLVAVLQSILTERRNVEFVGAGLSKTGEVVVCISPPEAVDPKRARLMVSSLFGLDLLGVVAEPEALDDRFVFFPAQGPGHRRPGA